MDFPYRRIADDLRQAILQQRFQPGERLPSEHALAERYQTTRATVRKATALLKSDGLVLGEQGRGVFVRPRPSVQLVNTAVGYRERRRTGVTNFNAEVAAHGMSPEQELLGVERVPAPPAVADRLGLEAGAPVVVRRRRFLVDGHPMQLADGYYEAGMARGTALARRSRIKGGAHAELEGPVIGRQLSRFLEEIDVRMPVPEEVTALELLPGVPVARVLRTAYDVEGRPVEVLESIVPCDRHRFEYEIDLSH